MQVCNEDAPKDDGDEHCNELGNQFFKRVNADDIVFEPCEEDDQKACNGVLKLWEIAEIKKNEQ